jgi:hypothetical protein
MENIIDESIISILGIESLPEQKKVEIISSATELVEKNALARIFESIPKDKVEKFKGVNLNSIPEDLVSLLDECGIDFFEILREEILNVKKDLLQIAEESDKEIN